MKGLILRLLHATPRAARAFRDILVGIAIGAPVIFGDQRLEAMRTFLWGTPQEQAQTVQQLSPLGTEQEALFTEFQRRMDVRHQMDMLSRYVLTLPALRDEGY
jgi:hypothetical protein